MNISRMFTKLEIDTIIEEVKKTPELNQEFKDLLEYLNHPPTPYYHTVPAFQALVLNALKTIPLHEY